MKVSLTNEELSKVIFDALCNGLDQISYSGVVLNWDAIGADYKNNKAEGDCIEDILLKMLNAGLPLVFEDTEGDEDGSFTLAEARTRIEESSEAARYIQNILEGTDDATDACAILEICLYGKVIFG